MCGRFVAASPPDELARYFGASEPEVNLEPSYNVAPTNETYVVRAKDQNRALTTMRWGLVPFWAKDLKIGSKLINARSETVATKPAYRSAYKKRRCLIGVDGFYEWSKVEGAKKKQPYYITRADGELVVFGGLWERWNERDEDGNETGEIVRSCTIVTCSPNAEMSAVHSRMPVLVRSSEWDDWLDPTSDLDFVGKLMKPAPNGLLKLTPVTTMVNSVRNKGEELIHEALPEQLIRPDE